MKHLTAEARAAFQRTQTKTLKEARYLGMPVGEDENGQPIRKVQGMTQTSANLLSIAKTAMGQSGVVGANIVKVWDDPMLNDATKVVRTASLAKGVLDNLVKAHAAAVDAGVAEFSSLSKVVAKTYEPPASAGQSAIDDQLRQIVRAMPAAERINAVRSDPAIRAAVARAPAVLSGLDPAAHKAVRDEHAKALEPEAFQKAKDIEAAIWQSEAAIQALAEDLGNLTDAQSAESLQAKSSATVAA